MKKSFTVTEETIKEALNDTGKYLLLKNGFDSVFSCPIFNSIPGCRAVHHHHISMLDGIVYECTLELEQWQKDGTAGKNPGSITVILDDMSLKASMERLTGDDHVI